MSRLRAIAAMMLAYKAEAFDCDPTISGSEFCDVPGADLVDAFAEWREQLKAALAEAAEAPPVLVALKRWELFARDNLWTDEDITWLADTRAAIAGAESAEAPAPIWQATFVSRHFAFEAYGATDAEARAAMVAAIERHCEHYPSADPAFVYEVQNGMCLRPIQIGAGYRDGEPL